MSIDNNQSEDQNFRMLWFLGQLLMGKQWNEEDHSRRPNYSLLSSLYFFPFLLDSWEGFIFRESNPKTFFSIFGGHIFYFLNRLSQPVHLLMEKIKIKNFYFKSLKFYLWRRSECLFSLYFWTLGRRFNNEEVKPPMYLKYVFRNRFQLG